MRTAPLFFRKSELLASRPHRELDGTVIVPAHATFAGRLYVRDTAPAATAPTTKGSIIIIPKKLLNKPLKGPDGRLAAAR